MLQTDWQHWAPVCECVDDLSINGQSSRSVARSKPAQTTWKVPWFQWHWPSASTPVYAADACPRRSRACDRPDRHCRDRWRLPPQRRKPFRAPVSTGNLSDRPSCGARQSLPPRLSAIACNSYFSATQTTADRRASMTNTFVEY